MALATTDLAQRPRAGMVAPGTDRAKAVGEVTERFNDSYQFLLPYFERGLRFYRMYRSFRPPKTRPWRANVFVPIPFANTEHGLSTLMEAWTIHPFHRLLPRERNDYHAARVVEMMLEWEDQDMQIFLPTYSTNKEMLLYGTSWEKYTWDWRAERNKVEAVSFFSLFPDPWGEDLDDCSWVIHRAIRTEEYGHQQVDTGLWDLTHDEVRTLAAQGFGPTMEREQLLGEVSLDGRRQDTRGRLEVLEEWTDSRVRTVINRAKLARAHDNRFPHGRKPFGQWVDHRVPHEIMGIGELEIIEKLVDELNDIRNQRLDVVSQLINNVLVVARSAGVNPNTLIMRPGQIIEANDVNQVKPLVSGGNPALGVQEEGMVRFDIQEGTANWGYNQGQTPMRRETATTVLALQRAAGLRFTTKVRLNEHTAKYRQVQARIANLQRFMPPAKWVRVIGEGSGLPIQVLRDDMQGRFDYIPLGSTAEPKEVKRAQLGQLFGYLLKHPRMDDEKFLRYVLDLYNIRDSQMLLSDEQMYQRMQMMQAMQALSALGGAGGQGGGGQMPTMIGAGGGPGDVPEEMGDVGTGGGDEHAIIRAAMQGL